MGVTGLPFTASLLIGVVVAEDGGFCLDDCGVCFGSSDGVDIQEPMMGYLFGLRAGRRVYD